MSSFGERLKQLQYHLYLSQTEFAKKIDISRPALSEYMNERAIPTITVVIKVALSTGISLNWLLLEKGPMFLDETKKVIPPKDRPKEQIKKWLDDFWSHANPDERAWLKIEMKKKFPEFAEWLKMMDRSQEENKESLENKI